MTGSPPFSAELLVSSVILRPLMSVADIRTASDEVILEQASLLGLQPTLDEDEDDRLVDTPRNVIAALSNLVPFTSTGYLPLGDNDRFNQLLRLLTSTDLFLSSLLIEGNKLTISGLRHTRSEEYMEKTLRTSLDAIPVPEATLILQLSLTEIERSRDIAELCRNARTAISLLDPLWSGEMSIERRLQSLTLTIPRTTATEADVRGYLQEQADSHQVLQFTADPGQNPSFLLPFLQEVLEKSVEDLVFQQLYDLDIVTLDDRRYVLSYRSASTEVYSQVDAVLQLTLQAYLSAQKELRYYLPRTDELAEAFQVLEDLLPTANGLISPYDRRLQQMYSEIQGYSGAQTMTELLRRQQEFYQTRAIQRRFTLLLETPQPAVDTLALMLHLLAKYCEKFVGYPEFGLQLSVVTTSDSSVSVSLGGNLMSLKEGLAIFTCLLTARQFALEKKPAPETIFRRLSLLSSSLPSELISRLVEFEEQESCSPSPKRSLPDVHLMTLPVYQVGSKEELRVKLEQLASQVDIAELTYIQDGELLSIYSVYTLEYLDKEEVLASLRSSSSFSLPQPLTALFPPQIASDDYTLDIVAEGAYYRFEVVESEGDDRFLLFTLPIKLTRNAPELLERLTVSWRRGLLLSAFAFELYRVTGRLWPELSKSLALRELTPTVWERSSPNEQQSLIQNLN